MNDIVWLYDRASLRGSYDVVLQLDQKRALISSKPCEHWHFNFLKQTSSLSILYFYSGIHIITIIGATLRPFTFYINLEAGIYHSVRECHVR